ncbi:MAG: hypothetical protein M3Y28_01510 [Armatimonadota bacterium]|nr:hypothetical protein [Armatimonadota bacterium]
MSVTLVSSDSQRCKFTYLLNLAQEQVRALETDDFNAFDRILAAKKTLIAAFPDAARQIAADPALAGVVRQIQDCDKAAQRLLYARIGRVMRTLSELEQSKKARRAYGKPPASTPTLPWRLAPDTSQFLDQKS